MITDILILGAGVSGLMAARSFQEQGKTVQVVDKGRGVGGRVATRWLGSRDQIRGRWDHGAQFVTLRSSRVRRRLHSWIGDDVLYDWLPSFSDPTLMRKVCTQGMNQLPKALAAGVTVHRAERIRKLEWTGSTWKALSESGAEFEGHQCLSTIPAPQMIDLILASELDLDPRMMDQIQSIEYERTLSLLAELDTPANLPDGGYVRPLTGVLDTVIDHQAKGISDSPTVTAHATPAFSLEWYDRDRIAAASVMRAALQEYVQCSIVQVQIHGWKFSTPVKRVPTAYLDLTEGLRMAGDGFVAGEDDAPASLHPRMESAMLSGLHAAQSWGD